MRASIQCVCVFDESARAMALKGLFALAGKFPIGNWLAFALWAP